MRLFGYLALLLCGILDLTMGSSVKPIQSMSIEDAVIHLNERILVLENRDTSDLAQKIKGECIVEVQNAEKRFLEEKNELAKKISELETAIDSKQRDLSSKLGELEERTSKQKQEISDVITLLEGRSDSTNDVMHMKKVLTNHTSEISSLNTRLIRVESRCSDPPHVGDLYPVYSGSEGRNHGAVATYDCRGNKIPVGNRVVECRSGKWIGELPQCVDPVCDPPCKNGGTCLRNDTCSCTPLFSGNRCQYDHSKCGLDLRNVGGNSSNAPAWPWMAALYVRRSENDPTLKFTCGGSIIHRHFILTSARCVHTSTGLIKSSDFKVRLGLTNLDDLTHLQEHDVKRIYGHPRFLTHDKYDFDIALLELENPIDYNLFVRPVCLPPTDIPKDNIFYKTHSSAQAVGFGHDKVVQKNYKLTRHLSTVQLLKDIDLVIQPSHVCTSSLVDDNKASRFTDRMFCASQEKSFTCMGDSGGPAMQSRLHEEGTRIWTQVGIVSWFIGCGLEEEYGFFTHLQKLMPWVDSVFETAFPPTPITIDF